VIFTSRRSPDDAAAYGEAAERMLALAQAQPGFLGAESARGDDGVGITVSYWADEASIAAWRDHAQHRATREHGRALWYDHFEVRIAKVERAYSRRADR
jgi:heme-degrading monooxygenase HmoA